jgi:hypothetical protein
MFIKKRFVFYETTFLPRLRKLFSRSSHFISVNAPAYQLTTPAWRLIRQSWLGSLVLNHLGDYPTPKTITYF